MHATHYHIMSGGITVQTSGGIATIELKNEGKFNAISRSMLDHLVREVTYLEEDPSIRVIILHGADGNFSSGADISDLAGFDSKDALYFHRKMNSISRAMRHSSKIYIALLEGNTLGGGFELSFSADIRIAADNTKMGLPEMNIGLNAGAGGNAILPRYLGKGNAMYYLLTGDRFDARKGIELGIVQKVVPQSELYREGEGLAKRILSLPEETVALTKMAVDIACDSPVDSAMDTEAIVFSWLNGQKEIKEKMKKFLEK